MYISIFSSSTVDRLISRVSMCLSIVLLIVVYSLVAFFFFLLFFIFSLSSLGLTRISAEIEKGRKKKK